MSFGEHLRGLREEAGISQAALARQAKIPVSTLGNWERDRGFPSAGAFLRLTEALGVSPERLAQGVEDPVDDEPPAPAQRPKQLRGFAAMDPLKHRQLASRGGKAAHTRGTGRKFTSEQARLAGAKGGKAAHAMGRAHEFTSEEARAAVRKSNLARRKRKEK